MFYFRGSKIAAVLLAPTPAWAQTAPALRADPSKLPSVEASSATRRSDFKPVLRILNDDGRGSDVGGASPRSGRSGIGIGVGAGIPEGKALEMSLWSGAGAVAGSLAGPFGAIVGAAVGAVTGLGVAVFAVPHNGPETGDRP